MSRPARASRRGLRPTRECASSGFTLVEVTVTMAVLLIGFLALTSTSFVVHKVTQVDRERRLANAGLTSAVERLQSRSTAAMNNDDGWSPTITAAYLAGGDPGPTFDVDGLDPWEGMASVGSIEVVVDETTNDDALGAFLGMPRDLDMDGAANNADVSADAQLLPVVVRVRWTGPGGDQELVQGFWITRM